MFETDLVVQSYNPNYSGGWGRRKQGQDALGPLSKFKVSLDILTTLCLQNKVQGWVDGSLSKALIWETTKTWIWHQNLCKICREWLHTSVISAWERQGQVDLWGSPASMAYLGTSRLIWDPVLKKKWAVLKENHSRLSSDLQTCVYLNTHKAVYTHRHTASLK